MQPSNVSCNNSIGPTKLLHTLVLLTVTINFWNAFYVNSFMNYKSPTPNEDSEDRKRRALNLPLSVSQFLARHEPPTHASARVTQASESPRVAQNKAEPNEVCPEVSHHVL